MKKGILITFEGGEGCGKSTQIKNLAKYFESKNLNYLISREPGGTDIGEQIREILIHSKKDMSSKVEFMLFSAARADHIEKVVKPALEEGKIVLLDRFYDSSYTYQGLAGDLGFEDLKQTTNFVVEGLEPDLTILFDLSYEDGMRRKQIDENLKNLDRIESKGKEYHDKVRQGFLHLAKIYANRFETIDAAKSQTEIFEEIKNIIIKKFPEKFK